MGPCTGIHAMALPIFYTRDFIHAALIAAIAVYITFGALPKCNCFLRLWDSWTIQAPSPSNHPQYLALELRAPMVACSGQYVSNQNIALYPEYDCMLFILSVQQDLHYQINVIAIHVYRGWAVFHDVHQVSCIKRLGKQQLAHASELTPVPRLLPKRGGAWVRGRLQSIVRGDLRIIHRCRMTWLS